MFGEVELVVEVFGVLKKVCDVWGFKYLFYESTKKDYNFMFSIRQDSFNLKLFYGNQKGGN